MSLSVSCWGFFSLEKVLAFYMPTARQTWPNTRCGRRFKGSVHKAAAREAIKKSLLRPAAAPSPRAEGLGFALLSRAFANSLPKCPCFASFLLASFLEV